MAGTVERTLALKLIGDVGELRRPLEQTNRQLGKTTKAALSWGKAVGGALVLGGIERVAGALGDAWKGYRSGEKVGRQLRRTWKNLGLEGKAYGRTLDRVTQSTLRLGTSDDEAVQVFNDSLKRTRDREESLRRLAVAQDLAASKDIGLGAAMKLVDQAAKGSARAVDQFGLKGKTAGERVDELGRSVKGAAKEKARLDPLGVLFNHMAEDTESIVGAFAKGDFKGFVAGLGDLGNTVQDALFGGAGKDDVRNSKTKGLVNQFGGWASKLAKGIGDAFEDVDWAKTIQDTLNTALTTLSTAGENGTLSTLGTIGAGIAGAIFAADLFVTAATAVFSIPRWAAKSAVGLAARAVGFALGGIFRTAMFAGETAVNALIAAAAGAFSTAKWGAKSVAGLAAKAVGVGLGAMLRTAMFVSDSAVSLFTGAASGLLAKIGLSKDTLATAKTVGVAFGAQILAGIAVGLTGVALVKAVADALYDRLAPKVNIGGIDSPNPANGRQLPQDPLGDIFRFITGGHAMGTPYAPKGWAMVGERGPELLRFRGGERVLNHRASMAATSGSGGVTNVYNLTVVAGPATDRASLGQEIIRLIQAASRRDGGVGLRTALAVR